MASSNRVRQFHCEHRATWGVSLKVSRLIAILPTEKSTIKRPFTRNLTRDPTKICSMWSECKVLVLAMLLLIRIKRYVTIKIPQKDVIRGSLSWASAPATTSRWRTSPTMMTRGAWFTELMSDMECIIQACSPRTALGLIKLTYRICSAGLSSNRNPSRHSVTTQPRRNNLRWVSPRRSKFSIREARA